MGFDQPFSDPILYTKRSGKSDSPFLDITELVGVINGQAILTEIPYRFNRVQIIEQVGVSDAKFYEVENGSIAENQFTVDYSQGIITFHPSMEGSSCVVSYKGTGTHYVPASRVATRENNNGFIETLDEVVAEGTTKISEVSQKITEANAATIAANNATANFQTLINEQKKIYKASVATYANISSTYPSPELGWTTTAIDTGIEWRYDGVQWINIGYNDSANGFKVLLSPTPPQNINSIWVDLPAGSPTTNAKVVQSDIAPTDTSVIWWKIN